jgi:hypothetical protein
MRITIIIWLERIPEGLLNYKHNSPFKMSSGGRYKEPDVLIPGEPFQDSGIVRSQVGFAGESCIPPETRLDWQQSRRHTALARQQHSAD